MSWIPLVAPIRTRSCSTFIQRSTRLPRIPIRLPLLYPKQSLCLWLVALRAHYPSWQPISNSFSWEQTRARRRLCPTSVPFSVTQLGGFSAPINVFGIFANQYGYATLSFGNFRGAGNKAFILAGPDGSDKEEGDETQFMLDTVMGLLFRP